MDVTIGIEFTVESGDDALDKRVLDIGSEEAHRFAAAVAQRLDDEGIDNIRVRIDDKA